MPEHSLNDTFNYLRTSNASNKWVAVIDPTGIGCDYRTIEEALADGNFSTLYLKRGTHVIANNIQVGEISIIGEHINDTILNVGNYSITTSVCRSVATSGTVSITQGSQTITGAGTNFNNAGTEDSYHLTLNAAATFSVKSKTNNTIATLEAPWAAPSITGKSFILHPEELNGLRIENLTIKSTHTAPNNTIVLAGINFRAKNVIFKGLDNAANTTFINTLVTTGGLVPLASRFKIERCLFEGAAQAINFRESVNGATIEDCAFVSVTTAITLASGARFTKISNCEFSQCANGIYVTSARHFVINGCTFLANAAPINITNTTNNKYVTITNCDFIETFSATGSVSILSYAEFTKISNCLFTGDENPVELRGNYSSITDSIFAFTKTYAIRVFASYCVVSGNRIDDNALASGLSTYPIRVSSPATNVSITNNTISNFGETAISVEATTSFVTISGNIIKGTSVSQIGIYAITSSHVTITGNAIQSVNANGILAESSTYITITGNSLKSCISPIACVTVTNFTISGNTIEKPTINSQGIYVHSTSKYGTLANNSIRGENIENAGISVNDSETISITGNSLYFIGTQGIAILNTNRFSVTGNTIDACNIGIASTGSDGAISNNVCRNGTTGISITTGTYITFTGNVCRGNSVTGITCTSLLSSSGNNITS